MPHPASSRKTLSLRTLVLGSVLGVVALGFAASVTVLTWQSGRAQEALAMAQATQMAQLQAREVAGQIEQGLMTARGLADALVAMKTSGQPNRAQADALQRRLLEASPALLGVWTGWEPDAFDGADARHAGQPGHDATGRYVPYWNRGAGHIAVEPLVDYDKPGAGDYYQQPKARGKETLIEPYVYKVAGKDTLITSLVVPIMVDGRFAGVAGVDISLAAIADQLSRIRPFETGRASLLSTAGQYLGDIDATVIGQPAKDLSPEVMQAIAQGKPFQRVVTDAATGGAMTELFVPVNLGQTGSPWSFRLSLPNDRVHAAVRQERWTAAALGVGVLLLLSGALAVLLHRLVLRPLGGDPAEAAALARRVAAGDLSTRVALRPGDTHSLMAALSSMQRQLSQMVAGVRAGADSVATASTQIAQGNLDLSQRTEEQASALQQTAATMDQLGATVRHNADSARQANQLAQSASAVAGKGGAVVGQVVETMRGISESSRQIGDIIGVIDGIAFQTNILALNAAVEAARAGEQGRGFAVVAGEVRTLAQRSAEAAKEIKGLIGRSVAQVEQGTSLVDQAGQTMDDIVASIRRVSDIVSEIASASAEQSTGISQVGDAVTQMDQTTQRNAALVEQSAAAAESLKGHAQQLVQAVSVFKLDHGQA
jgi:methyl-accepting chemotaxis protein